MTFSPETLQEFNSAAAEQATEFLADLYGSAELATAVVADRPFASVDDLCSSAQQQLQVMSDELVMKSVQAHPPIGAVVAPGSLSEKEQRSALFSNRGGATKSSAFSCVVEPEEPSEASVATRSQRPLDKIRELNPQYEKTYGYTFLICASGLTAAEILAQMEQRLTNDPKIEWSIAKGQLAQINELRVRQHFG